MKSKHMAINKLNVGVFMGGKSIEREVSFNSGRTVCDHLDTTRYNIIPIFQKSSGDIFLLPWKFLHRGKTKDFEYRLESEAKKIKWDNLKKLIDFMFLAIHGRFAEDGTIQGFLEILNIPYLGSKVLASALSMNKVIQKKILAANNISTPNGITIYPEQSKNLKKHINAIFKQIKEKKIYFPCIIKPCSEGSSMGVSIVLTKKELESAILHSSKITPEIIQPVLIEEKINGMEFTCITITDYKTGKIIPLPPTEVIVENNNLFDYKQKYMPGQANEITPPRCNEKLTKKIQKTCVNVAKILGMTNTSRTDGFLTKNNNVIIVDPNSLTGMGPSSFFFREAAHIEMNHTELINHLIETELQSYNMLETIIEHENKTKKMKNLKKTRVAILLGGNTNEKEISLESGRNVSYKLYPQKYKSIPIFVSKNMELFILNQKQLVLNSTKEIEDSITFEQKINWNDLPKIADFIFISLHGGKGENGSVQGALEMLGLPYNGSTILTSALCSNKFKTNQFLKNEGFNVPNSILILKKNWLTNKNSEIEKILKNINFPIIIKPHNDGCSMFVSKININSKKLSNKIDQFFERSDKSTVMIEECIKGMELTVGVIGNEKIIALPPSQTVTSDILTIEEKFLPGAGENKTPAPLSEKTLKFIQKTIEQVYKSVECSGYARIDCFYQNEKENKTNKERIIILEINTLPGITPATCIFHQASEIGLRPMEFIDQIIQSGIEKHKKINLTNQSLKPIKKALNKGLIGV